MGATFAEWVNQLNDKPEADLIAIVEDAKQGSNKRAAAGYCLEHLRLRLDVTRELCDRTAGKAVGRTEMSVEATVTTSTAALHVVCAEQAVVELAQRLISQDEAESSDER